MTGYEALVAQLISRPISAEQPPPDEKLAQIAVYARALFGGKISIPSIVVSGTKGKGSTCTVADSVLRHNGLRTGLFTSPHLTTPRERIRVNGRAISEAQYVETYHCLDNLLKQNSLQMPPFFALHTLMAGIIFSRAGIDGAVIECGVGGRYDWTKIFEPRVTGITSLGYDHLATLGTTPSSISWHKFGICTEKSLNFTTPQQPDFQLALMDHVAKTGIPITTIEPRYAGLMGLRGPCAEENSAVGARLAQALADVIGRRPFEVAPGVKAADIGGRFQSLHARGVDWLLDGAHTLESVTFCNQWYEGQHRDASCDVLLCATTKGRDPKVILAPLFAGKKWKEAIWVRPYHDIPPPEGYWVASDLPAAIARAISHRPGSVLVTGSLYLVGDLLKELNWRPPFLE
jgi:folylpolyglutamate synthase